MRKYNSVTYEVGKAKAEQAAGMFGLAAGQRTDSCPSRGAVEEPNVHSQPHYNFISSKLMKEKNA